jgi:glutamine synthetase
MQLIDEMKNLMEQSSVEFVDLRFTNIQGQEQHITVPKQQMTASLIEHGKSFDGSSIDGWCDVEKSDMLMRPDLSSVMIDPFANQTTLIVRCDVIDPVTKLSYAKDPRAIAKKAEQYLRETGIADVALFGPELEFFIFDDVRYDPHGTSYFIDSQSASWNSNRIYENGNLAHRARTNQSYFQVAPLDKFQDIRNQISNTLQQIGIEVEAHHHEVASCGQNEVVSSCQSLLKKADQIQTMKYVIRNVVQQHHQTVTFMPKPLMGQNGSGMHCHQSLLLNDSNLFAGNAFAGLSDIAQYYIGGILTHAGALNAFTNPTTNSYKRFVEGFEAPINLSFSSHNRTAAIRIPHADADQQRRIEVRFPDPSANPYLAFSAMLMAGIDGIQQKMDPNETLKKMQKNETKATTLCRSLNEALEALDEDNSFLKKGEVFEDSFLKAFKKSKQKEVEKLHQTIHPLEFEMYYSL